MFTIGECTGGYRTTHGNDEATDDRWIVDPEGSDRLAASAAAIARLRTTGSDLASRISRATDTTAHVAVED